MQREVLRNLAVEVAYTGSYADRVGRQHRRSLRARAVLQQRDERPRCDAAVAAAAAGAESVQHRQLRLAGDDQPDAVCSGWPATRSSPRRRCSGRPASRLPAAVGPEPTRTCRSASSRTTRSRSRVDPPLCGRPQRQRGVRRAPGDGEPDGRNLRPRADVVADEPERAAVASQRRRRLRVAVRQDQAVPERRRRGRGAPRRMADRRHVRVPAGCAARLGQPVLQRRSRAPSPRTTRRSRCSATARST